VYVIGLSPALASEEVRPMQTILDPKYFGQYGNIVKCVVKRTSPYKNCPQGVSFGCYITFSTELEAAKCIMVPATQAVSGFVYDERELLATYGSTKYCVYFLKNIECSKAGCLYLHRYGQAGDVIAREDILKMKTIQPPDSILEQVRFDVMQPDGVEVCLPRVSTSKRARPADDDSSSPNLS
jgi:CCR4-NOT transcription complex subunit 4